MAASVELKGTVNYGFNRIELQEVPLQSETKSFHAIEQYS